MSDEETDRAGGGKRPLDDLLAMRGKPFADWKEEREYLRRKWGEQGKRVEPGSGFVQANPEALDPITQPEESA